MNAPASRHLALDPALVEAYRRDGVVRIRSALPRRRIDALRAAVDRQFAERARSATAYDFQDVAAQIFGGDAPLDLAGATRFDMKAYRAAVKRDDAARPLVDAPLTASVPPGQFFYQAAGWRAHPEIRGVALDSDLPEIAAVLLDALYVNFWEDTTFIKTPGAVQRTAFHQDKGYFQISGDKCCVVWIALDDVDADNGALEYVRGSHRWGEEFAPNVFFAQTPLPGATGPRLPDIEGDRERFDIVRIDAEIGDVIVHDVLTVHGAGGNRTADRNRRAISFRYCGDDIRYFEKPGAIPQIGVESSIEDGAPLASRDYPLVWPRPFPGAELSRLFD